MAELVELDAIGTRYSIRPQEAATFTLWERSVAKAGSLLDIAKERKAKFDAGIS